MTDSKSSQVESILDEIQSKLNEIRDEVFWIGLELEYSLDKLQEKKEN